MKRTTDSQEHQSSSKKAKETNLSSQLQDIRKQHEKTINQLKKKHKLELDERNEEI